MEAKSHNLLRFFKKADQVFDWISKICIGLCGVMLIGIAVMICTGVFTRAFTTLNLLFVEEWSSLLLVPMSYLAFGYTLRKGRHFKVDLVIRKLPEKWQTILAIFSGAFSLVCLYYMILFALDRFGYIIGSGIISSGPMRTPLAPFAAAMLCGICLFAVDMLFFLIYRILELKKNGGADAT